RVLRAAEVLLRRNVCNLTLLGEEGAIRRRFPDTTATGCCGGPTTTRTACSARTRPPGASWSARSDRGPAR
ncbi:hypothetical protein, partial [Streptomyces bohaiensis]